MILLDIELDHPTKLAFQRDYDPRRKSRRTVDIDEGTIHAPDDHRIRQKVTRERKGNLNVDEGRVCADDFGNRLSAKRLYDTVKN